MERVKAFYEKNEHSLSILFFIGGFVFDVVTLERIDSWFTISQQVLYLLLIQAALLQMFFEQVRPKVDPGQLSKVLGFYYQYRPAVIHFFLGTLLNLYTIFFFKSSSLLVSFGFLVFLVFLLIANESSRFKALGLPFKFVLLAICHLSFFAYIIPTLLGSMGLLIFLFSVLTGSLPLVASVWWIQNFSAPQFERAKSQILIPVLAVLLGFLSLYVLKLIPPIPLSINHIGVYHEVQRTGDVYRLGHERVWWRFWENGDQIYYAQRGDKIYVFFRIFSPTNFSDQVLVRWYWKDNLRGWTLQDSIPIKIVGGREEGFRGFGVKSNYQPGKWKVQVETIDGREIGRIYFDVILSADAPRAFDYDEL